MAGSPSPGTGCTSRSSPGLRTLATSPFTSGPRQRIALTGPDRLVGLDDKNTLRVWRLDGDELRVVAERKMSIASPVDLPGAGVVAVNDLSSVGRRRVRYLDGETLADVPTPTVFDQPNDPTALFASPDRTRLAVGYRGYLEVIDVGFAGLAGRPLAATTPADLHTVRTWLDRELVDPAARPFFELLRACLVHRFELDVAIGEAGPVRARGDDIALGGSA